MKKYTYAVSYDAQSVMNTEWRKAVASSKIHCIEYAPDFQIDEAPKRILTEMCSRGEITVGSVHIPFVKHLDPSNTDAAKRAEAVRMLKEIINDCESLHSANFTLHGGAEPVSDNVRSARIAALRESLFELSEYVHGRGVSINIELLPRTCIGNSIEELIAILSGMPNEIGVCFDVNHMCGYPDKIAAGIKALANRIRTLHISDYDGVDECHWHPGLGVIDWPAVMDAIRSIEHEVLLILEITTLLPPEWQKRTLQMNPFVKLFERDCAFLENADRITAIFESFKQ